MIWRGKHDANGAGQEPNPLCWMLLLPKPWAELPGQKSCSCGAMRWGDVQAPSSGKKPPLWKVRLAQTHGLLGAIGTKKKETNPGMGLVPREYLFSFQFGRESGYNHNRGNKLGLGKKEKSGNLLGFKDLGSLRMYFTLHCSCHIHLERLMCSHCRLQSSPARDPVPAATGRPRKQDQGALRRKSFCSLGSTPPYQNGVVNHPFTRGGAASAGLVLPVHAGSDSTGALLALGMHPFRARALPPRTTWTEQTFSCEGGAKNPEELRKGNTVTRCKCHS